MVAENDLLNVVEKELLNFKDELLVHSKIVKDIAIEISNKINKGNKVIISDRDKELIEVAALLHDVKKFKGKNHPKIGAEDIKQYLNDVFKCNKDEKKLICLMVRWHKGDGYIGRGYRKKQIRMIEILRAADKISKIYKKSIEYSAYSIIEDISSLQKKKVRKAAALVFLERVKSLNER